MMKKAAIVPVIIFVIVMLSVGIVDNILALSNDINNHMWVNLVGRWQSSDRGFYEMEFKPDGTFVEYFHGTAKGAGKFQIAGKSLDMLYDPSYCDHENEMGCIVHMEFEVSPGTLILHKDDGRTVFKKVKE